MYKQNAIFYIDQYEGYPGIILAIQHRAIAKPFRRTHHIERLNCTLRQRISRWMRATLSFSKKLSNPIGAIHDFICHYNLTLAAEFASQNAADWNIRILLPLLAYHYLDCRSLQVRYNDTDHFDRCIVMKHTFAVIVLAFTSSYTISSEAGPSAFRCNYDLVEVGGSKVSVLQKCGEPMYKDSFCKPGSAQTICETVDEWTYNPGYGQFMTTLRFESGKLVSITYGDRVK